MKTFGTLAVAVMVQYTTAQNLTAQSIEAKIGEQAMLAVSLSGATSMTALQFNLVLPEGVTVAESTPTLGTAANGHTLAVETLDNGDRLFVLYSMDLNTFRDGQLLSIPVTIGDNAKSGEGSLSTVRFASTEAVSNTGSDTKFNVTIKTLDGIETVSNTGNVGTSQTYDLFGRKLSALVRGINLLRMSDGTTRKVMVK